jgi:hypothetical protein
VALQVGIDGLSPRDFNGSSRRHQPAKEERMSAEGKRPFWAECKSCNHRWAVAYLPMELNTYAALLMSTKLCPSCGASGESLAVPRQKDSVLPDAN